MTEIRKSNYYGKYFISENDVLEPLKMVEVSVDYMETSLLHLVGGEIDPCDLLYP
jgi:hypothetical protein